MIWELVLPFQLNHLGSACSISIIKLINLNPSIIIIMANTDKDNNHINILIM